MSDDLKPTTTEPPKAVNHESIAKYYLQPLAIVLAVVIGIVWRDHSVQEAQSALTKLQTEKAVTGALQITGNVYQGSDLNRPSVGFRRCTLSLSLSTVGDVPVRISSIEVRTRKGKLPNEWVDRLFAYEEALHSYCMADRRDWAQSVGMQIKDYGFDGGFSGLTTTAAPAPPAQLRKEDDGAIVKANHAAKDATSDPRPPADPAAVPSVPFLTGRPAAEAQIFSIAANSKIWSEAVLVETLYDEREGGLGSIYPNQNRPFAVDFLIDDGSIPELVLIEAEIKLEGEHERVRKWSTWIGVGPGLRCGGLQGPYGNVSTTCFPNY